MLEGALQFLVIHRQICHWILEACPIWVNSTSLWIFFLWGVTLRSALAATALTRRPLSHVVKPLDCSALRWNILFGESFTLKEISVIYPRLAKCCLHKVVQSVFISIILLSLMHLVSCRVRSSTGDMGQDSSFSWSMRSFMFFLTHS